MKWLICHARRVEGKWDGEGGGGTFQLYVAMESHGIIDICVTFLRPYPFPTHSAFL